MKLKYFEPKEFKCKCGKCGLGFNDMDQNLLIRLDKARELAGVPFVINSAIRCPSHNAAVGSGPDSSHIGGYAVDISARDSHRRMRVVKGLLDAGFTRIGINPTFIHADTDPEKPQEVMFLY